MAEVGSVLASHAFASAGVAAPSTNLPGEDAAQNASMLADASGPGRLSHSFIALFFTIHCGAVHLSRFVSKTECTHTHIS